MRRNLILLVALLLCVSPCLADTIYFKDGKKLDATIIEKTDRYIKVDVAGVPLTYFSDEIQEIKAEKSKGGLEKPSTAMQAPFPGDSTTLHVNTEYGFEISGPKGWLKDVRAPIPGKTSTEAVVYSKHDQHTKGETVFPNLMVTIDVAPENITNAVDFSKRVLQYWREVFAKYKTGTLAVIEEPHEIELNGLKGSRAIFDLNANDGKSMRNVDYKFMRNGTIISVMGGDWSSSANAHLKDFEDAAATFKFIGEGKRVTESGQTRKRKLGDVLAAGKKQYGQYEHATPKFVLKVPEGTSRNWHFVVFNEPAVPFYLVNDATFIKDIPFISSMVSQVPPEKLLDKEAAFKEVAEFHREWEKKVWGEGILFANSGSPLELKGFSAFERVVEVPGKKLNYHFVYIFVGDYLLQLGLNTTQADYANDDKDFMRILATLSAQ
ncbi:MAG: hypothetical protein AB1530_01915 [Candidatus Omnitrophota bacterium]